MASMQEQMNGQENPGLGRGPLVGSPAFAVAALCVAVAFVIRWLLDPVWGDRFPYVVFEVAVFVVTQFCGIGPVVFTLVTGFLLGDWFFVPPRHSFLMADRADQVNTVLYFIIGFGFLFFSQKAERALARERAAREELRKQAEAQARLAAIVESSDDAIIGKTLDGTIVSWNAAAERLYGYTAVEAVGKSVGILVPPDRPDETMILLERVASGERVDHFETVRRTKASRLVEVSLSVSPVRGSNNGRVVAVSTIARDITERKKAERKREELLHQVQAALNEAKTLSGLIPICAGCKKIRDEGGGWEQVEVYVAKHSDAKFTHGLCPDCTDEYFPGLMDEDSPPGP